MIKTLFIALCVISLTAAGYFFGTGPHDIWWLVWFAPLPVLAFSVGETRKGLVFLVAVLGYFLGHMYLVIYSWHVLMPMQMKLVEMLDVIQATAVFGVIVLLTRFLIRKRARWWTLFFFPTAWVVFEFFLANFSNQGTAGNISYSQLVFLPVVQLASVTGVWGVSFVISVVPSGLAVTWYLRKHFAQAFVAFVVTALLIGGTLGFGYWRLAHPVPPKYTVRVGLLAAPTGSEGDNSDALAVVAQNVLERYAAAIEEVKKAGAKVVVMPEKMLKTDERSNAQVIKMFAEVAQKHREMLVFGLDQRFLFNRASAAFAISNAGDLLAQYRKHHLSLGPDSGYVRGRELAMFATSEGDFGIAICKDMDFINPALDYAKQGVNMLLAPSEDFTTDRWLRAKPAIMRGIAGGYSVVRSAALRGLLLVSDKYGRVLAEKPTSETEITSLVVDVPVYTHKTMYGIWGNIIAWLLLAIFGILMALVVMDKRQDKKQ